MTAFAPPSALLEHRGTTQNLDAFVVSAAFDRIGAIAAFALGDGSLRIISLGAPERWDTVSAHEGAILALAPDAGPTGFVTGGDDGKFLRIRADGTSEKLADHRGKWVEHVASFTDGKSHLLACGVGRMAHLLDDDGGKLKSLEHPSTVTGIDFDGRGKRLAASHYNGASLWFTASKSDSPRRLEWKGSHTGIVLHPAGEAVVTSMQDNALHGWRLPGGEHMRMSGYPSKCESLSFSRNAKYLASSGADSIILWPFFGGGPMGKAPLELAQNENAICTRVACHPRGDMVAAGYADGSVVLAEFVSGRVVLIANPTASPVSALAWSPDGGHLAFGTEQGFAAIIQLAAK